jgi:glycosyltransferase involved in cell wall biosynthesis
MRILIATWHQCIVGGIETYLRDIVPALRERGHEIALLYENLAPPNQARIDSHPDTPNWQLSRPTAEQTLGEITAWRPDICFLHGFEEPALQEALATRFPTVLLAHNYHGTCISGNKRFAFPVERPCHKVFGPACLLHYFARGCGGKNPLAMFRHYDLQRRRFALLPKYRSIVVTSRAMQDEYIRHGIGADKIHRVPLFPTGQTATEPMACRPRSGMVLFIGRLTDAKGCHVAIEAVHSASARLQPALELVVAGDGPERARLEKQARRPGARVRFAGWVNSEQRTELLAQADAIVVPSVWPEPFGLVGLEAACHSVPAVGFAVGGIPDWLIPGETGELAPGDPPTVQGLADALVRALADNQHHEKLRAGAWRSTQLFRLAEHVERLEAIFAEVQKGPSDCEGFDERFGSGAVGGGVRSLA